MQEEVEKAAKVLQDGGVILYPTDTVWGLGCDPKNDAAIEKIDQLKNRQNKSYIILVDGHPLLQRYAKIIPEVCYDLIEYANRPLTIVYPKGQYVSEKVLGADGSIAIRIAKDKFCQQLIRKCKFGLVSTSANLTGSPTPLSLDDIPESIRNGVDYIVNLNLENPNQPPSQIIKIGENSEVTIIRK